jgi:ankyrin repeat protein
MTLRAWESALHVAMRDHDVDAIRDLLRHGADPRTRASTSYDQILEPLDILCWNPAIDEDRAIQCMDVLLAAGATVSTARGILRGCILQNTRYVPMTVFQAMLDRGADPDYMNAQRDDLWSDPALIMAMYVTGNADDVVYSLLRAGANPNITTHMRYSDVRLPLHGAIAFGRWTIVDMLLRFGADPYAKDPVSGLGAKEWTAYRASKTPDDPEAARYARLFRDLETCRESHRNHWDSLKKELVETVWHPARLHRLGYFTIPT